VSKTPDVSGETVEVDRRQQVRVVANGSVMVYAGQTSRGRISNISSGGMLVRLGTSEPGCRPGEHVEVDLHLDRRGAKWLRFGGEVLRSEECEVAIGFTSLPLDFADVVQNALVSALEGAAYAHVLLVDQNAQRRGPFAALLRKAGCRVAEVATPLEAIAHLGGSSIHSWVVAISSTVPASTADELQRFLKESDAPVDVKMLSSKSPSSALTWFTAVARRRRHG
jgi:CheY-like chemotaxis protein